MNILCLQLARFGDIYQTWPALSALRRQHPAAKIQLVVRERFVSATVGLTAVDEVIVLPTASILGPMISSHPRVESSLQKLDLWLAPLQSTPFDKIINLSFSPVSSYLTDILARPETEIHGYSRFRDGFLNIVDDASSYFYAQVGVDRSNRVHLTDLFGLVSGVELTDADFVTTPRGLPEALVAKLPAKEFIVCHLGASDKGKTCGVDKWREIVDKTLESWAGAVVLVGSADDGVGFEKSSHPERVIDLTGQTELFDVLEIVRKATALIGGDSVAIHLASLTNTPTLNVSFSSVRFWETGPRAKGSRVIWFEGPGFVDAGRVARELVALTRFESTGAPIILKNETFGVLYSLIGYEEESFAWDLTRALYMSSEFPVSTSASTNLAFQRLSELAQLGVEQIRTIEQGKDNSIATSILDQIDHLVEQVAQLSNDAAPAVRWFQGEKTRIGPGDIASILTSTERLFAKLRDISHLYTINQKLNDQINRENLTWKS